MSFENHVNYVRHADRELTEAEVLGLAALFNSTLLDRYFRSISGNTQVNATEIRTMPFPDVKKVVEIGRAFGAGVPSQEDVDRVVFRVVEVPSATAKRLVRSAS